MAKFDYGRQIEYGIRFNVDKSALNALQSDLQRIQSMGFTTMQLEMNTTDIDKVRQVFNDVKTEAKQLEAILNKTFNASLGTFNFKELNSELNKLNLGKIQKDFNSIGITGANAFRQIQSSIITQNTALKQSNEFLEKMATTFKNTVRYGISSSIFNNLSNSIQKAYEYTIKLDSSLNDIRIVTDKSAESMNQFALKANKAAQGLGKSTRDYTEASLIYYQQGLNDEETAARTETTLKAANVTGQSTREVSEQLTAVWNGYKVSAAETEHYVDKLAAVAAATAADLEELSVGMSKVASAANIMGVDVDQLNAQLATIVSVTREAPESIGTSLKTIYARMSDIEAGLDGETSLGKYTADMADMGINVLDTNGKLRDMGDVIEEIGGKWSSMSREQQVALAQTVAGTRQYSRLMSLFDNWGMYNEALETSKNSMGTLQHQQDIYMETTQAHLQQLNTAWERFYSTIMDKGVITGVTDGLTTLVKLITQFTESIGGGIGVLNMLGTTGMRVFSVQIAKGLTILTHNIQGTFENLKNNNYINSIIEQFTNLKPNDSTQVLVDQWMTEYGTYIGLLDEDQAKAYQTLINNGVELKNNQVLWKQQQKEAETFYNFVAEKNDKPLIASLEKTAPEDLQEKIKLLQAEADESEVVVKNVEDLTTLDASQYKDQLDSISSWLASLTPVNEKVKESFQSLGIEIDKIVKNGNFNNAEDRNQAVSLALSAKRAVQLHLKETQATINTLRKESEGYTKALNEKTKNVEENIKRVNDELSKVSTVNMMVNLIGSFGQLATAISMVPKLSSIWNNENLSDGEKLLQTTTSLVSIFTMLAKGMQGVSKTLPIVAAKFGIITAAEAKAGVAGAAMWVKILGPIALVVAALAAVGGAIYALYLKTNEAAITAEKATEDYKLLADAASKAIDQYTNLYKSISNYQDSYKAIQALTKGTEEWNQKVLELNNSVLELIDKFPALAEGLSVDANGILQLDPQAQKRALREQEKTAQKAITAQSIGKIYENTTSDQADIAELQKDLKARMQGQFSGLDYIDFESLTNELLKQSAIQPDLFVKETDVTRGEEAPLKLEEWISNNWKDFVDEDYFNWSSYRSEDEKNIQNLAQGIYDINTKAYEGTEKGFSDVLLGIETNTQVNQSQLQNLGNAFFANNETVEKNSNFASLTKTQKQLVQTNLVAAGINDINMDNSQYKAGAGINSMNDKARAQKYIDTFYPDWELSKDKSGAYEFKTSSGDTKTLSDETIAYELEVNDQIQKQIENNLSKYTDVLVKINKAMGPGNEKASDVISQSLFDYSQGQAVNTNLFKDVLPSELEQIKNINLKDIISEEDLATLGMTTEELEAYRTQLEALYETYNSEEATQTRRREEEASYQQALSAQADALKVSENELNNYVELVQEDSEYLKEHKEEALDVAEAIITFGQAMQKLSKDFSTNEQLLKDWRDGLTNSEEAMKAVAAIQDDLEAAFHVDVDMGFVRNNLDLIKKASEGDVQALNDLQVALAHDYVMNLHLDPNVAQNINNTLDQIVAEGNEKNIKIGASINNQAIIDDFNKLIESAGMTEEEVNNSLNAIGYEPVFEPVQGTTPEGNGPSMDTTMSYTVPSGIPGIGGNTIQLGTLHTTSKIGGTSVTTLGVTSAEGGSGKGPARKIQSIKRIATPSTRANTIANKGSSGSGGKKSGGGGKGGGGGSSKKADKMDPLKEEIDRYHDVNVKLEQIETTLDRLEDAEDKAFGGDLVKNYNKQIEALNNQITVTQQKLGIAADEMKELQGKLSGSGVRFNSDGTIGNYAAALKAQENYVNGIINHYNSLGADAQESYKETVEQAKENFDKFKENLERYDKLVTDEIPDLQNQIQEAIDKITEKNIEKFKMEVDLRLDMAEAERDWNEFKKKVIDQIDDDDILGNAKARIEDLRTYLNDLDTGEVQALGKHVQETLDELRAFDKGLDNVYGRERAQSLEDLEEYFDNLKDALEEIVEIQDELQEDVLDQMDAVQDKIDDQVDTFEAISDLIEHDMTLIQLTLGEDAYAELSNFYKAQQDNYNKQLDFQRQQVDYWKQQMDAVEQGSEQFDAAREKWADAVADWNDLVENTIENLQDQLENTINAIFKNLNDELTNNKGLQYVSDEFEIVGERAEQFLDEINRLQGIADLADKYQDAINNTDNISAQRKLNAAMEEQLNTLKSAERLSEKDIERAQKKYDLTVAQIALEEAQAQKNTLRLRRDTQGNYRYQYVADDEAVNEAENKLKEAYNSLYNFDKERYLDNLDEALDVWNEYQEKMAEAAQINDPKLRWEKEQLIAAEYEEIINGIVEQNEKIRTDLRESAFMDLANLKQEEYDTYMNMTQEEQDVIVNGLVPQWEGGIQQMLNAIKDKGGFEPTTLDAFNNIKQAAEDYDAAVQDIQEDINATVGDVLDGEDKIIAINQDLTVSNNDVVDSYKAELTAVQELAAGVNDLADAYKDELQAAKDAHDYLAKQREEAAKAAAAAEKGKTAAKETVATPLPETKPAQTTAAPAPAQNSNPRAGYRLGGQAYTIVSGDTLSGIARRFYGNKNLYPEIWQHNKDHLRGKNWNRIWPGEIVYLDTGGYTGEWNNGGKLGVLHQKELVLNAKDTRNLLDTVAIMRNITAAVGENTLQRLSGATSGSYIANGDGKGILEQDVHITANFPNVRSAIEIETALNNLTNAASQYIGKQ